MLHGLPPLRTDVALLILFLMAVAASWALLRLRRRPRSRGIRVDLTAGKPGEASDVP